MLAQISSFVLLAVMYTVTYHLQLKLLTQIPAYPRKIDNIYTIMSMESINLINWTTNKAYYIDTISM